MQGVVFWSTQKAPAHVNAVLDRVEVNLNVLLSSSPGPMGGVIEGISAGMFLIGMMVAVISLLVYRQRLRKV